MLKLEFWFEFASPYSYLAAVRIGDLGRAAGVEVVWRPFILGPIFADRGWTTSPFNLYPDKGQYMWRDVEREAEHQGVPFERPSIFPVRSVLAARVALLGVEEGFVEGFAREAFRAHFVRDEDLGSEEVIDSTLAAIGLEGSTVRARACGPAMKDKLRESVDRARSLGIFGAPSFVVGRELFWGNDRLERAIEFALSQRDVSG
ncbi:2-hydroxychromene-2-carboxylate isomerase [Labilithrix luteola]|uniref:2-hydroxychromene-2-carboxylate isomerase n=1 Tax=Labilithrix luteola TaxID=1391654 RepID=A0A0K1Q298_9BACT|nr:2-hydroxychromene-2-carboxylate isomerase [Labilithrix luteola]AKU99509.1 2-hydroxychromene-2-carboxylate isomerase [Labilithrix luteola]